MSARIDPGQLYVFEVSVETYGSYKGLSVNDKPMHFFPTRQSVPADVVFVKRSLINEDYCIVMSLRNCVV